MSGIAGFFHPSRIPSDPNLLRSMAAAIAHRGPDHEGLYQDAHCALASRQPAIMDLPGDNQPMVHPETGAVLVFDGAIYNFQDLRAELAALGHVFQTRSHAEVLLAAYVEWGEACPARLDGMFAFAVWSPQDRRLFLARDRMGEKPLVYTVLPDQTLVFASEIKAILRFPGVRREFNPTALDRMLDYGFNLAPSTFFEGIYQVMPGTCRLWAKGQCREHTYWRLPEEIVALSEQEAAEGLRHHLTEAVRARSATDVPVAAYLSGGIDSSAVTGLYASLADAPVHTLSITFDDAGYDERDFARLISERFGTVHHEFVCSIAEHELENLIRYLEAPAATLLNLPLYLLSRQIRDMGLKVVLSGDGADEILGGYDYFKLLKLMAFIGRRESPIRANLLRRVFPALTSPMQAFAQYGMLKGFPAAHPALPYRFQAFQFKDQFLSADFQERLALCREDRLDELPPVPAGAALFNQALFFEARMRLPNLTLALGDAMSMANSVELRSPFMDHHLVEYVFSLPAHYKMRGLNEKSLLKKSMRGLLPESVCRRRKQPLAPPSKWFVRRFRSVLGDVLSARTVREKGYFRPEFMDHMLREFDADTLMDYSGVLIVAFFLHLFDDLFLQSGNSSSC